MRNRLLLLFVVSVVMSASNVVTWPVSASVRAAEVTVSNDPYETAVEPFRLIGIRAATLAGLELRTSTGGVWGNWEALERAAGPDLSSDEVISGSKHVSEPVWVGRADGWQIRGPGSDAAEVMVVRESGERIELPASLPSSAAQASAAPAVRLRTEWGARAAKTNPSYASSVKMAFVHHTVNSNTYSRGDVPAMLRAIQAYHMDSNGWDDIGYNTLVDRFGEIWEGRGGGFDRPVIGAHTSGFNTGSTGVAILGEFTQELPSSAATAGVAAWLAWKLPLTGVDPQGNATMTSGGNERYPKDTAVTFPAIAGHRDGRPTACPGQAFYERLGDLRSETARRVGLAMAYPGFDGGVWIAAAELDGDAGEEVISGADAGGGAHLRTFEPTGSHRADIFPFGSANRGGVRVAGGNLDALGVDEIVAAAGPGDAPEVRAIRETGGVVTSFMAYTPGFRGGVFVASGNVDGVPGDEIITGPGPGGGPHVRIWNAGGVEIGGFMAYTSAFGGGVRVAAADVDGDGIDEIVTAPGSGGGPHVRILRQDGSEVSGFMAYHPSFGSGVYVGATSQGVGNPSLIVTGAGEGGGPHVRVMTSRGVERAGFMAGFPNSGVRVAGGRLRGQDPEDVLMTGGPRSLSIIKLAKSDGSALTL
ncbi:MAG TPA: peptidoglycan recognition protein [Acidimicrobiales bacterium]|nr:peptidoglycan recognition protein [Acidimicrobiales bacterium]